MANIIQESVTVSSAGPGLVRIALTQVHDDGQDMGGQLVFDQSSAKWLADQVERAADAWGFEEVDVVRSPDHFIVYVGGSDWQPFVHVHNVRDPDADQGGTYAIGMTADAAKTLFPKLRTV